MYSCLLNQYILHFHKNCVFRLFLPFQCKCFLLYLVSNFSIYNLQVPKFNIKSISFNIFLFGKIYTPGCFGVSHKKLYFPCLSYFFVGQVWSTRLSRPVSGGYGLANPRVGNWFPNSTSLKTCFIVGIVLMNPIFSMSAFMYGHGWYNWLRVE